MTDQRLQGFTSAPERWTIWVCAKGECPLVRNRSGPCNCREIDGMRITYADRVAVEVVPRAVAERLAGALGALLDGLPLNAVQAAPDNVEAGDKTLAEFRAVFPKAEHLKDPCLYPLADGRRCAECETCHPVPKAEEA